MTVNFWITLEFLDQIEFLDQLGFGIKNKIQFEPKKLQRLIIRIWTRNILT